MTTTSLQQPRNVATDFAALQFVVASMLNKMQTAMPVRVMGVTNEGGVSPVGRVDVLPLINMVTGDGQAVPHATIYNVPYVRIQGGADAVILDPKVGDMGICLFASRDMSAVKADPEAALANGGAPPGSARTYDFADGVYMGGILNGVPTQYVQFHEDGITVVSPTRITLDAPEVYAGDIELLTHTHSGVTTGGGSTGPPI